MNRATWAASSFLFLAATALCQPALAQRPGRVPEGVKLVQDLEYIPGGHERNKLDLYLPEKSSGPLPVIVFVHGGAWMMGSKQSALEIAPLMSKGYAVAAVNYRLSQHARFPAQIEDCKAAVRWLRANAEKYNLDTKHFGAMGGSAGGHLVALLGTSAEAKDFDQGADLQQSSRVQAVVDWFGPTDFLAMGGSHDAAGSPESKLVGGAIQTNKEIVGKANPITYVSKDSPPFLIMHGDQDHTVPINQSELLHEALKGAGTEVTFVPIKGAGHGGPQFFKQENMQLVEEFFGKHLKQAKGEAAPADAANLTPKAPDAPAKPATPEAARNPRVPPAGVRPNLPPAGVPAGGPANAAGPAGMPRGPQGPMRPGGPQPGMRPAGPRGVAPGEMRPGANARPTAETEEIGKLVPPAAATALKLTPAQLEKVAKIQQEAEAKLAKIMTPEQATQYAELKTPAAGQRPQQRNPQ